MCQSPSIDPAAVITGPPTPVGALPSVSLRTVLLLLNLCIFFPAVKNSQKA